MTALPPTIICNAIVGITVLVSFFAFSNQELLERLLFDIRRIIDFKEYDRIASSALIHSGWGHLLFNMFSFHSFGSSIEATEGPISLLLIYIGSVIGGGLLSLLLHRNAYQYRALGASGGVCGVIFAAIFLTPGTSVYLMFVPIPIPAWLFAILFVGFSYYAMFKQLGNIGHDAHLGGAITGLLITTIIKPSIVANSAPLYLAVVTLILIMVLHAFHHIKHPNSSFLQSFLELLGLKRY